MRLDSDSSLLTDCNQKRLRIRYYNFRTDVKFSFHWFRAWYHCFVKKRYKTTTVAMLEEWLMKNSFSFISCLARFSLILIRGVKGAAPYHSTCLPAVMYCGEREAVNPSPSVQTTNRYPPRLHNNVPGKQRTVFLWVSVSGRHQLQYLCSIAVCAIKRGYVKRFENYVDKHWSVSSDMLAEAFKIGWPHANVWGGEDG